MTDPRDMNIDKLITALEGTGKRPAFGPGPAQDMDETLADLAAAAPDATPPDDLFNRIEAEIDADPIPGVETVPAEAGTWKDRGMGVWMKFMSKSPDGKNIYMLRCGPGSTIPAHNHRGWEYALVLEGKFQIAGRTLRAGDAQVSAANSHHPEITSDTGCLILVVA